MVCIWLGFTYLTRSNDKRMTRRYCFSLFRHSHLFRDCDDIIIQNKTRMRTSSGKEILTVGDPYSPQQCKNRPRRHPRLRTFALFAALLLLGECQGGSSSLTTELNVHGCSTISNHGNHTNPPKSSVESRRTSERKQRTSSSSASSSQRQGILRIQREWKDAIHAGIAFDWTKGEPRGKKATSSHLWIGPMGTSLLTWHFSLTGVPGSVFENGVYHGRIVLPPDYPSTPPRIMMLTPSGRFIPGHDICLSASNYHPETWQPNAWSLRTIVESLRLHMCTAAKEIGGLNDSYEKRQQYAQASRQWAYRIHYKHQSIWIDHGMMLERGFFPNENEQEMAIPDGDAIDDDTIVITATEEETESSIVQKRSKRKRKRRKRKYVETQSNGTFVQVIRQTLTNPLRMSVLTFFLLFVYLNL